MEKTGNGTIKRSEESITLMTSYRLPYHSHRFFTALRMTSYGLPYHGHRHFTFASDDALPSGVILNGGENALWKRREMER